MRVMLPELEVINKVVQLVPLEVINKEVLLEYLEAINKVFNKEAIDKLHRTIMVLHLWVVVLIFIIRLSKLCWLLDQLIQMC